MIRPELAKAMCSISLDINRQVGVLADRRGVVEFVIVGDTRGLFIPSLSRFRLVPGTLRGIRLLHTHLFRENITDDDITDLALLRLDSITAVYYDSEGNPNGMKTAHLLPPDSDKLYDFSPDTDVYRQNTDYEHFIKELEDEISSKTKKLHHVSDKPHAILVGCYKSKGFSADNMAELYELARSAGMYVSEDIVQVKEQIHPKYVVGPGKLKDIVIKAMQNGADFLVFDNPLTPAQAKAIGEFTDLKIIDRPQLILDIFAKRAQTNEGKIRVELAQMKYLLPRLTQKDDALSRLTGGIGGRGPGNTKLEIDRRRVNERITFLSDKLKKIEKNRYTMRARRNRNELPVVSIIGYTNAGKSTLLNNLTQSGVYADDLMFATLDTSSKRIRFPEEKDVIITDTVGFIRDLPENLKGAFKSTLEELFEADLLVHVLDIASEGFNNRARAVELILSEMGISDKDRILVLNKSDRLEDFELDYLRTGEVPGGADPEQYKRIFDVVSLIERYNKVCMVSALDRKTFRELLELIRLSLFSGGKEVSLDIEGYFGLRGTEGDADTF